MKVLALCDSPTLTSGFARVAQNLFKCWAKRGAKIDCFGIAFAGWNYKSVPYVNMLFPAGDGGQWCSPEKLEVFLTQLQQGNYTHVWIMQDTFLLSAHNFPETLQRICRAKNIKSMLYFPVDAPLDPAWTDIIAAVDVPVAYTDYGAREAEAKGREREQWLKDKGQATELNYQFQCASLPHGVDTDIYREWPRRKEFRHWFYQQNPWLTDDDFVIINVNSNQCRKDTPRTLEIFAGLLKRGLPAKLVMHMPENHFPEQQISLEACGRQLGLKRGQWCHHGPLFRGTQSTVPESGDLSEKTGANLVGLYNMADLYLTTTLGEGWGLGITEALACGTPVAMPDHTSCHEIGSWLNAVGYGQMGVMMMEEEGMVVHRADNSRMRPRVDLRRAIDEIEYYYNGGGWRERRSIGQNLTLKNQWSWDRVAAEMQRLYKQVSEVKAPVAALPVPSPGTEAGYVAFGSLEVCQ